MLTYANISLPGEGQMLSQTWDVRDFPGQYRDYYQTNNLHGQAWKIDSFIYKVEQVQLSKHCGQTESLLASLLIDVR